MASCVGHSVCVGNLGDTLLVNGDWIQKQSLNRCNWIEEIPMAHRDDDRVWIVFLQFGNEFVDFHINAVPRCRVCFHQTVNT